MKIEDKVKAKDFLELLECVYGLNKQISRLNKQIYYQYVLIILGVIFNSIILCR